MIQYIKKPLYCGFFCFMLMVNISVAQFSAGTYAVYYKDKPACESMLGHPETFLSSRSLNRRAKHSVSVSCADVPVDRHYMSAVLQLSANQLIVSSKWLNASVFKLTSDTSYRAILALPFVDSLQLIEHSDTLTAVLKNSSVAKFASEMDGGVASQSNRSPMQFIGADYLNRIGYCGDNVLVAVFDGGFISADQSPAFNPLFTSNRVVQTHDFVSPDSTVFRSTVHGTAVWGLIAGVGEVAPIGAASRASYCLYRTEDVAHESKIEEFYWAAAMERADSAGADVVNSSLGYNEFDDSLTNYRYSNFEGSKSIVSRIAEIAWERGIFVVNSAGNDGHRSWHYIIFPADVPQIMSVGSVNSQSAPSFFTSQGFPESTCIKPEVAALGEKIVTVIADGTIGVIGNGTSFAAPAVAGGAACLIGAFPRATNDEIKSAIVQSSSHYSQPDLFSGYGVPDFRKAFLLLQNMLLIQPDGFVLYPNPAKESASVLFYGEPNGSASVELRNYLGELIYRIEIAENGMLNETTIPLCEIGAGRGIYSVSVRTMKWCTTMPLVID